MRRILSLDEQLVSVMATRNPYVIAHSRPEDFLRYRHLQVSDLLAAERAARAANWPAAEFTQLIIERFPMSAAARRRVSESGEQGMGVR